MTYEEKIKTARYIAKVFYEQSSGLPISEKPEDLSWSFVYGMAKKHSVTALVFEALGKRVRAEAPPALYLDWQRDALVAGAKHLAQKSELSSIEKLFSENEIPYVLLKGFLIKELYKSPELREMTDIDIFVGKENLDKAAALLRENGFTLDLALEVHDSYKKPPFIEIELHRILHRELSDYTIESAAPSEENPYRRLMTDEDFLVFLLHHAKKHDETGGAGMRTVFDFYLIFKNKKYDEEALLKRLESEKLLDFYERLRSLIDFWFSEGKGTPELLSFEIYTVTGGVYGNLENKFLRKSEKKCGVALFFERLFPSYKAMVWRYPVLRKCPLLLPIFYIVRIVKALFNGSGKRDLRAMRRASKKKKELEKLSSDN